MKLEKLEAIRGFAALYIVANHVFGDDFIKSVAHPLLRLPFRFGQEIVMIFFLLSGFVIYISTVRSTKINYPRYLLKRFVRIYPILIATFILSIIAAIISGYHFSIDDVRTFIGNLFMMQDLEGRSGSAVYPFLGNWPLWTLSYECGFYIMFYPIYIFFVKEKTIKLSSTYVVLLISMVGWLLYFFFPNHIFLVIAYFSLWWTGVACAQVYLEYKTFTFKTLKPALFSLLVMAVITSFPFIWRLIYGGYLYPMEYPVVTCRHYFMAMIFILLGLAWWNIKLKGFDVFVIGFKRLAPISYGLYISHDIFIKSDLPVVINPYVTMFIKLVLAFVAAWLLEIKMQPVFNRLLLGKQTR